MNKIEFLKSEIKHVLEVVKLFEDEDKAKYLEAAENLNEEELVKVLKMLYKIEQEYFEFIEQDTRNLDKLIKSSTAHE